MMGTSNSESKAGTLPRIQEDGSATEVAMSYYRAAQIRNKAEAVTNKEQQIDEAAGNPPWSKARRQDYIYNVMKGME